MNFKELGATLAIPSPACGRGEGEGAGAVLKPIREGQKLDLARALRREPTEVEKIMWRLLRDRRFGNVKFRRQAPVGPYVADFACPSHRLVIELDGGQHAERASDRRRDAYLARKGWRVLRFWNGEVVENPNAVLWRLGQAVGVEWDPF